MWISQIYYKPVADSTSLITIHVKKLDWQVTTADNWQGEGVRDRTSYDAAEKKSEGRRIEREGKREGERRRNQMRNDEERNKYHVKCGIFLTSDD